MRDYSKMTGPELVAAYNAMLETPTAKKLAENDPSGIRFRTVPRFSDTKSGIKRCEALERLIYGSGDATKKKKKTASGAKTDRLIPKRNGKQTNRQAMKDYLLKHAGRIVPEDELTRAVYGSSEKVAALRMVMRGFVNNDIKKDAAFKGFELERSKVDGKICFKLVKG